MRAIMLDFDGVVHPVSVIADWRSLNIGPADLPRLVQERGLLRWLPVLSRALDDHPDVLIAVHSGWRGMTSNMQMREFLGPLASRFIGVTSAELPRHAGIVEFALRAGFDHYLVIDDAIREFPPGFPELLATHPERGLEDEAVCLRLQQWLDSTAPSMTAAPSVSG